MKHTKKYNNIHMKIFEFFINQLKNRDYEAAVVEFKSWAIIYCTLAIIPGRKYSQMSFKLKLLLD